MERTTKEKLIVTDFLKQLLDLYEFELYIDTNSKMENVFKLNDMQGANWSYIEQDEFSTLADIIERLDSPHQDYIYKSLEERQDANENIPLNDWDLTAKRYIENNKIAEILSEISPEKYLDLDFPNGNLESKEIFQLLNNFEFPLLLEYAIPKEEKNNFFLSFSLEQLQDFEKSLYLYYETNNIIPDNHNGLISIDKTPFNIDIIDLSEGLIDYEEFIDDNACFPPTIYEKAHYQVYKYFKENDIKDLMDYGADADEGLYYLTTMYSEILNNLDVEIDDIYTEDGISDGKYVTEITLKNDSEIELDTSAWNGIDVVIDNINSVLEEYEKLKTKELENKNNKDIEIDI